MPDALAQRATITAAQRGTTFKKLVIKGLEQVIGPGGSIHAQRAEALARLRQGFHLGGKPLPREIIHERKRVR